MPAAVPHRKSMRDNRRRGNDRVRRKSMSDNPLLRRKSMRDDFVVRLRMTAEGSR